LDPSIQPAVFFQSPPRRFAEKTLNESSFAPAPAIGSFGLTA
jgi:hypothetical protein